MLSWALPHPIALSRYFNAIDLKVFGGSYSIDKIAVAIVNCLEPNHGFSAVLLPADTIAFTIVGMWDTN